MCVYVQIDDYLSSTQTVYISANALWILCASRLLALLKSTPNGNIDSLLRYFSHITTFMTP